MMPGETLQTRIYTLADFEKLKEIGRGGKATVHLAKHLPTGNFYALKETALRFLDASERRRSETEATLLNEFTQEEQEEINEVEPRRLPPARVCRYYGQFEEAGQLYLVLEFLAGAPLHLHLRGAPEGRFDFSRAQLYIAWCAHLLGEMHIRRVVYRDLKLANLILELPSGRLRLVDLGLAKRLENGDDPPLQLRRTYSAVGTVHAMAPEVLEYTETVNADGVFEVGYTLSVDWWSLGILACELLAGRPPFGYRDGEAFEGKTLEELAKGSPGTLEWGKLPGVLRGDGEERVGPMTSLARNFVARLLEADPRRRLGSLGDAAEVLEHDFLAGVDLSGEPPPFDVTLGHIAPQ